MARADGQEGFTLIEVLVALAVFSLAALALLNLAGENTRTASAVSTGVIAEVVAENRAIEVATGMVPLTPGLTEGADVMAGRTWRWTRKVSPTAQPDMLRIDLSVALDGSTRDVARLTLFRGLR